MKKVLTPLLVLAGLQGLLAAGYFLAGWDAPAPDAPVVVERLDRPAPALAYRTLAGEERRLSAQRGRPMLVHFWATWCPPCREELPGLLALAAAGEIAVLAVSLDPEWEPVRRFLGNDVPPAVVLASSAAVTDGFGVTALPATFLVDATGRLRLHFAGARDWRARAVRQTVSAAAAAAAGGD